MAFAISLLILASPPKCKKFIVCNKCIIFNYIHFLKMYEYSILKLGNYLGSDPGLKHSELERH